MSIKLLIIGEARGLTEEQFDHGFVGSAGRELVKMIGEANLAPKINMDNPSPLELITYWKFLSVNYGIEIANIFEAHPSGNHLYEFFDKESNDNFMPKLVMPKFPGWYVKPEHRHHITNLYAKIQSLEPNLTLLMGNIPCWAILHQTKITQIRGTIQYSEKHKIKCLPTFHPSYIIRGGWPDRPVVLADLDKAKSEQNFTEVKRIIQRAWLNCTLDEIHDWLNLSAEYYAIDIESGYALYTPAEIKNMTSRMRSILSQQISMVGFSRSPYDAMVIEFMTRKNPDSLSYWPNREDEIKAWYFARFGCERLIPKIFQNGLYDMNRLIYAGIKVRMSRDDPMLLHHSLFPEMKKSLGFLASIYTNNPSWKQMYALGETLKRDD